MPLDDCAAARRRSERLTDGLLLLSLNSAGRDPKETSKNNLGSPTFRENDGALIAKAAYERGLLAKPQGQNRSYDDFVAELTTWG
ncbi:hypothetical protein [Streptomyces halstedii]|uniref:hypothetical protein n=1 Tax=Streptomyces halstedii TaxID=1944 RepID=UPI00382FFAAB